MKSGISHNGGIFTQKNVNILSNKVEVSMSSPTLMVDVIDTITDNLHDRCLDTQTLIFKIKDPTMNILDLHTFIGDNVSFCYFLATILSNYRSTPNPVVGIVPIAHMSEDGTKIYVTIPFQPVEVGNVLIKNVKYTSHVINNTFRSITRFDDRDIYIASSMRNNILEAKCLNRISLIFDGCSTIKPKYETEEDFSEEALYERIADVNPINDIINHSIYKYCVENVFIDTANFETEYQNIDMYEFYMDIIQPQINLNLETYLFDNEYTDSMSWVSHFMVYHSHDFTQTDIYVITVPTNVNGVEILDININNLCAFVPASEMDTVEYTYRQFSINNLINNEYIYRLFNPKQCGIHTAEPYNNQIKITYQMPDRTTFSTFKCTEVDRAFEQFNFDYDYTLKQLQLGDGNVLYSTADGYKNDHDVFGFINLLHSNRINKEQDIIKTIFEQNIIKVKDVLELYSGSSVLMYAAYDNFVYPVYKNKEYIRFAIIHRKFSKEEIDETIMRDRDILQLELKNDESQNIVKKKNKKMWRK